MVLAKVNPVQEEYIVAENKFIANNVLLVGIRKTEDRNIFMLLFVAYQDYDNSYIYLQTAVVITDEFDYDYLNNHQLNLDNIKNNLDTKAVEEYKKLISMMNDSNIYSCDMSMKKDIEHPSYYLSKCVRVIDDTHVSIMNVYFPFHNFVRLNVFFWRMQFTDDTENRGEKILLDKALNHVKLYDVEYIRINGTKVEQFNDWTTYTTHYTVNCGPTEFRFNFRFGSSLEEFEVRDPLDAKIYDANYKDDPIIIDNFIVDNILYLLHFKKESIEKDMIKGKYSLLAIPIERASKETNLIDPSFIFIKD